MRALWRQIPERGRCRARVIPERRGDEAAIRAIHLAAFERPDEAGIVDRTRGSDRFVPAGSLVAWCSHAAVGHALFSWIDAVATDAVHVLALGPIGVLPAYQGQGIGASLIHAGVSWARSEERGVIAVLGDPSYYGRFGFAPAHRFGVGPAFAEMMLLDLGGAAALRGRSLAYPAAFDAEASADAGR